MCAFAIGFPYEDLWVFLSQCEEPFPSLDDIYEFLLIAVLDKTLTRCRKLSISEPTPSSLQLGQEHWQWVFSIQFALDIAGRIQTGNRIENFETINVFG